MHIRRLAPLLSAAASIVRIWIMLVVLLLPGSDRAGPLDDAHHLPRLAGGEAAALGDLDQVAFLALGGLVVGEELRRAADVLAVALVLDEPLHRHRDRLLHLVADDGAGQRTLGTCRLLGLLLLAHHLLPLLPAAV